MRLLKLVVHPAAAYRSTMLRSGRSFARVGGRGRHFTSTSSLGALVPISSTKIGGGSLDTFSHSSTSTGCEMTFKVFTPPASSSTTPVVYYLSGLTCDTNNFAQKAPQAFAAAAKRNCAVVIPDTSPRGEGIEDDEAYDLGQGAGFYVDATKAPWSKNFKMYSFVARELPKLINEEFDFNKKAKGIMGHSMGGHGALTIALKEGKEEWASVSAFAPILNPTNCDWGKKAFSNYFENPSDGDKHDATKLIGMMDPLKTMDFDILIDQGSNDEFLSSQLVSEDFLKAAKASGKRVRYNLRDGYDHSYNFVSSFVESHIEHHANLLHPVVNLQKMAQLEYPPSDSVGKPITCRAMVARGVDDIGVETIEVAPPKAGEVRVKVIANALCHTDIYTLSGADPEGIFPSILGHEAGCIVESVGEGVTTVKPGDHVVPAYTPQCNEPDCIFCMSEKTNLCPAIRSTQGQGVMPDGTTRFKDKHGKEIFHFMGCSTFSEYTVLAEISCAKVQKDAPLDRCCLFGCGISTGLGAVWNTCKVERGATVAVFGLGAVGLSVIQGAAMSGASKIIAVDVNQGKFEAAKKFGATDCVDSTNLPEGETIVSHIAGGLTQWGVDYSFDCTGITQVMRDALECSHRGWGQSCVIGVAAAGHEISTRPFQLVTGRKWVGTAFGGFKSRTDVPILVKRYCEGDLPIDDYVTHEYRGVEGTAKAIDALHSGDCLRAVVKY